MQGIVQARKSPHPGARLNDNITDLPRLPTACRCRPAHHSLFNFSIHVSEKCIEKRRFLYISACLAPASLRGPTIK